MSFVQGQKRIQPPNKT